MGKKFNWILRGGFTELKMSNDEFVSKLQGKTGKTADQCGIIKEILDKYGIIGRKNKEKIIADFVGKFDLSEKDADNLYNDCMEIILKNILQEGI